MEGVQTNSKNAVIFKGTINSSVLLVVVALLYQLDVVGDVM